jgi:DNA-directed RNA polymerase I, II, and III subunit RPABC4
MGTDGLVHPHDPCQAIFSPCLSIKQTFPHVSAKLFRVTTFQQHLTDNFPTARTDRSNDQHNTHRILHLNTTHPTRILHLHKMSAYQPPSAGGSSSQQASGSQTGGQSSGGGAGGYSGFNITGSSNFEDTSRPVHYLCGDCDQKVTLKKGDPIRCKECGYRVLYKERTNR